MHKVYCEHNSITKRLRELQRNGQIELVHYPVDPNSRTKHIKKLAKPSEVRWKDANVLWEKSDSTSESIKGSEHWNEILRLIGIENRRDALHVDSAYKTGCICLITKDGDILKVRHELTALLKLNIFSPVEDNLYVFLKAVEKNP